MAVAVIGFCLLWKRCRANLHPPLYVSCRMGSCSLHRRGRAEGTCNRIRRDKSHLYSLDSPFLSAIPRPNTDADG